MFDFELNSGQMLDDVRLAINGHCPVEFYGKMGGVLPGPEELAGEIKKRIRNEGDIL